jgi:hypothetical protein
MSFPTSPVNDQTYVTSLGTSYKYVSADTAWKIIGSSGGGGTGTLTGTGSSHYLPVWTSGTDMTASCVYQSDATTYINYNTEPFAVTEGTFTQYGSARYSANNGLLTNGSLITIVDVGDYVNPLTAANDAYPVCHGHIYGANPGGSFDSIQAIFITDWNAVTLVSSSGNVTYDEPTGANNFLAGYLRIWYDYQTVKIQNLTGNDLSFGWSVSYYPNFSVGA